MSWFRLRQARDPQSIVALLAAALAGAAVATVTSHVTGLGSFLHAHLPGIFGDGAEATGALLRENSGTRGLEDYAKLSAELP
jgi:hypothetical protein